MPQELPEGVPMKRARAIAARLSERFAVQAHRLLAEYPACRLSVGETQQAGSVAAIQALYDLRPAVVEVLSLTVLEAIGYMVGSTAITEAVDADLRARAPRKPQDVMPMMRANAIMAITLPRLLISADILLDHYRSCKLKVEQVYGAGEAAALDALVNLPPAVVNVASDRALYVISYFVGWTAAFDAIDADLFSRFRAGRLG
jgi:hypothetical protein